MELTLAKLDECISQFPREESLYLGYIDWDKVIAMFWRLYGDHIYISDNLVEETP